MQATKKLIFYTILLMASSVCPIHLIRHYESENLLKNQIDESFRQANKIGAIHKLIITQTTYISDADIEMEYYYMPNYSEKERETIKQHESPEKINPFLEIEKGLFIKSFGDTHILIFNKYNIFDKHVMVISREYQPQTARLNLLDFHYTSYVCQALDGVLYFNGGMNSGSSQDHKHIQIVPSQAKKLPIYIAITDYLKDKRLSGLYSAHNILNFPHFHFIHGIIKLGSNSESFGDRLFKAYEILLDYAINNNKQRYSGVPDYNFVASDSFAMIVPRSQQKADQTVSVNALGFLGSLLFKDKSYMERFSREYTPSEVLGQVTYP